MRICLKTSPRWPLSFFILTFLFIINSHAEINDSKITVIDDNYNRVLDEIVLIKDNPLKNIEVNSEQFDKLIKLFDSFRPVNLNLGQKLLKKVNAGDVLSGDDLYALRRTVITYARINRKLLDFAKLYSIPTSEMANIISSADEEKIVALKSFLIYVAGHIAVLDHMEKMHSLYYQSNGLFRRIIKNALKDKDGVSSTVLSDLIKMSEYVVDTGNSKQFANRVILARSTSKEISIKMENDPLALSLLTIINTTDAARDIAQGKNNYDINYHAFIDSFAELMSAITNWFSSIFGNIAGNISWRKGFLFENQEAQRILASKLRPMDVILEKSPFVLTDKFIPGHYGHVALYLGTKDQLQKINMWNHPSIIPYQSDIEAGKIILEAIRPGVQISKLSDFMNIDEATIIRKRDALDDPNLVSEDITRGIDQIGKAYDFNFDVETLDKIVCSELIYIVFGKTHWPTKYRFGRATITPDDVAEIMFQHQTKFNVEEYIVSRERDMLEKGSLKEVGYELNFEMRASDGSPIKDINDPTNLYWKKDQKCFALQGNNKSVTSKACKTTYTLENYEENLSAR